MNLYYLGVSLYFISWPSSSEARHYFSTKARHERQSLATYEEWQSRQNKPSTVKPPTNS